MKLKEKLIKINEEIRPYYYFIGSIALFVSTLIVIYNFLIKPKELTLILSKENIEYPSFVNENLNKAFLKISALDVGDTIKNDLAEIQTYLLKSKNHWRIEIINETNKTLNKLDLRILNINYLSTFGVNSNYLTDNEKGIILKNLSFQKDNGIISLNSFTNLPPKRFITFNLWGELTYIPLQQNIIATYDGGEAKIIESKSVSGFTSYLVDYLPEIVVVIFLSFFLIFRYSINKYKSSVVSN